MSNIVCAKPLPGVITRTKALWQWDAGQIVRILDTPLPHAYTAEFSNGTRNEAVQCVQGR